MSETALPRCTDCLDTNSSNFVELPRRGAAFDRRRALTEVEGDLRYEPPRPVRQQISAASEGLAFLRSNVSRVARRDDERHRQSTRRASQP
jgi:hypothetical protein